MLSTATHAAQDALATLSTATHAAQDALATLPTASHAPSWSFPLLLLVGRRAGDEGLRGLGGSAVQFRVVSLDPSRPQNESPSA